MFTIRVNSVSYFATESVIGQLEADGLDVEFVIRVISGILQGEPASLFESGDHLVAGKAVGYIMLWTSFRKTADGIEVLGAYYHRAFPVVSS